MTLPTSLEDAGGGRRVRVARLGSGTPVVLLHGYPENLQVWSKVAPLLAAHHEVVAFDWPGMGLSDAWPGGATPHAQADRLAVLLERWGFRDAHVAGIDMGGQPALVFAARHAARCRSVAALNSLLLGGDATSWEIRLLRRYGLNRLILSRLPAVVFRRAERTFLAPGPGLDESVRKDMWDCFRKPEVRAFIVRMCAGYQGTLPALPDLYRAISRPCLALWGERDAHFPPVHARRLGELVAGSRVEILEGAGHWMPLQREQDVAAALLAHFARADEPT